MSATDTQAVWEQACQFTYTLYNQGEFWFPQDKPRVRIADMDSGWRHNTIRFIERHAAAIERRYTFGEIYYLSRPAYQEVLGELGGVPIEGDLLTVFDLMSECVADDFDRRMDERGADPIGWLRGTELYRALAAGGGS